MPNCSPRIQSKSRAHVRWQSLALLWLVWAIGAAACNPRPTAVHRERVNAKLLAVAKLKAIVLVDTLEALIAEGQDTTEDREFTYWVVSREPIRDAADAFARAAVAGRLAETKGISASGLVAEAEQYAETSMRMDPSFRRGAAQRMLGTLWVVAPAMLLKHGDSEKGLELLEDLAKKWPQEVETRLRLAEGYIALSDLEPSYPHLCFCLAHERQLRRDDRELLKRLIKDSGLPSCR